MILMYVKYDLNVYIMNKLFLLTYVMLLKNLLMPLYEREGPVVMLLTHKKTLSRQY